MTSFNCVKTKIYINLKGWNNPKYLCLRGSTLFQQPCRIMLTFTKPSYWCLCCTLLQGTNEYDDEFISCMSLVVNFKSETKTWNLPNDLFEVSISMIDTSLIDNFISYFTKSIYHNSWYFNSHSMHCQIKIKNPICVNLFLNWKPVYSCGYFEINSNKI